MPPPYQSVPPRLALHAPAYRATPGVTKATVALLAHQAEVEYDPSIILDPAALAEVVEDAGFDGAIISVKLPAKQEEQIEVHMSRGGGSG